MRWLSILLITLGWISTNAQDTLSWEQLEIKKLKEVVDTTNTMVYDAPVFPEKLKAIHKKKVILEGYMSIIKSPDEQSPDLYLIQRYAQFDYAAEYPLDALVEVVFKKKKIPKNLQTGNTYHIQGKLILNESDPTHPFYLLKKAKLL